MYPGAFWVEDEVHDEDGLVTQRRRELSGEAWDSHRIILSWEDIAGTARQPADGYNVVLHEFAHYLDAEGLGLPRGATTQPAVVARSARRGIRRTLRQGRARRADFLDPYGAEDEAEFFAVVTEEFLECAAELREAHPALYALLREFYGIDPAQWAAIRERSRHSKRASNAHPSSPG